MPDNNLRLGVSQALDNLVRGGAAWLPNGDSQVVTQWMAEYGGTLNSAPTSLSDEPTTPDTSVDTLTASSPDSLELPSAKVATNFFATEPSNETTKTWDTASQPLAKRELIIVEQTAAVAACTKCPQLVCSRTRTVYGVGSPATEIVFIGEGPGAEEDRQGIPFVGAAGQLLDKIILAMKLQRSDVYIMNAVKCRPQNNRTPTDEEIANCHPYFKTQLETIQPKFIVCLGAVAARALLNTSLGIGKLRGKFYPYHGAQVAVTYHPAYLLRTPEAKKLTWDDMKMVMSAMAEQAS